MEFQPLDAVEIGRNRSLWQPVPRGVALTESLSRTVAVIHRAFGRDTASLFQPSNRFYRSNGPYLYDGLRYFLYLGSGVQALQGGGGSLGRTSKPPEAELEPMEFEDQSTGEFKSLGSPTAKTPKTPAPPKPSSLPIAPKPPSVPEQPLLPDIPEIPDLPTLLDFAVPKVPGIPTLPEIPTPPTLPAGPDIPVPPIAIPDSEDPVGKIPVEIQLEDAEGNPMSNTGFQVEFPDGSMVSGESDQDGMIRIPDNTQSGDLVLTIPGLAQAD